MLIKLLILLMFLLPLKADSKGKFTFMEKDSETYVCYNLEANAKLLTDLKLAEDTLALLERKHLAETQTQKKMYKLLLEEKDSLYLEQKLNTDKRIKLYKEAHTPSWHKYAYFVGGMVATGLVLKIADR